jgi:hypothetical protein
MFDAVNVQYVLFDFECEYHPLVAAARGAQAQEFFGEGI